METRSMTKNRQPKHPHAVVEIQLVIQNEVEYELQNMSDKGIYEVSIDFDDASACWRANKKHTGNETYKYVCGCTTANETYCKNPCKRGFTFCAQHCKTNGYESDFSQWLN
jgi:hypothetical protein